jgi:hypothetical protein
VIVPNEQTDPDDPGVAARLKSGWAQRFLSPGVIFLRRDTLRARMETPRAHRESFGWSAPAVNFFRQGVAGKRRKNVRPDTAGKIENRGIPGFLTMRWRRGDHFSRRQEMLGVGDSTRA